jgi:hypothetical protein
MFQKYTFFFVFLNSLFVITGCATVELTSKGGAVRSLSPGVAQNCNHLGLVNSWKPVVDGGLVAAQIDIRNKVGNLGGNAMIVISQVVDPPPYQHAQVMAEAYFCKFKSVE